MQLSLQQQNFFDTFGYLVFPGLLRDEIETITQEFRAVFDDKGLAHTPDKRTCLVPFIDQREYLCGLLDDARIRGIADGILGEDWNYIAGDGNYYSGDTPWHSDGYHRVGKYLKIALYLDEVKKDSGALRVIPGSHRIDNKDWPALKAHQSKELWGIEGRDVPCVALESTPGDVVAFNHNLMHASFGGSSARRMFTINMCSHCQTPEELGEMRGFIESSARFWIDSMHGDLMKKTASPRRMRNLQQVMDNEDHLPGLAAKARREMSESSRG